ARRARHLPCPLATADCKIERAGLEGLFVFIPSLPAEPVGRGEDYVAREGRVQPACPLRSGANANHTDKPC
ncbi:MAG TPA: hypothetical protein VGR81_02430, partial [Candidatus Acidoferrales bacterium]|nr:hypothetical protein [Candidatus Acidoferrales bacterium]